MKTSTARSSRAAAAPRNTTTRERLMSEALKLLATDGLNVSLRRIVQASGAGNPSALHYHFGTREALVGDITQMLKEWLEPRIVQNLETLKTRHSVRDVLEALFGPVIGMLEEPRLGRDAIRFIGRLSWEFGVEGQQLSAGLLGRSMSLALQEIAPLLPKVDAETLKFRLILNINNVFHGLVDRNYLSRSPFGAVKLAQNDLREAFVDYLEAGVRGL